MQRTSSELATFLNGTVEGDPSITVQQLAKIEEGVPGSLTFLANPEYEGHIYTTQASVAIIANNFKPSQALPKTLTLIRVADPYAAFAQLLEMSMETRKRIEATHSTSVIASSAKVGNGCYIGPLCVIEDGASIDNDCELHGHVFIGRNAVIGSGSVIHPGARILDECVIGENCVIQSGAIIGGEGFGFAPQNDQSFAKVPQTGNVIIGSQCEIGSGTTIDRSTLGSTRIGNGVKLDNQIQVAHNVIIGDHTVIAAQTGIAGSTTIGAHCMIGGQVGFAGHLNIADGVKIAAQSGVTSSIKDPNTVWQGTPAMPIKMHQKQQISIRNLVRDNLFIRVKSLETLRKDSGSSS